MDTHFTDGYVSVDELIVALEDIKKSVPDGGKLRIIPSLINDAKDGSNLDLEQVSFSSACYTCFIHLRNK